MNNHYERVYEVGLLDDLHNYFPALLYQQNSFQTVSDVLGYIRDRTTERFNLFDYGRRQYENTIPMSRLFPQQNTYVPQVPVEEVHVEFTNSAASLFPLLRSLGGLRNRRTPNTRIYEDVIVHASQTIIDGASREETLLQDLEALCSICQDRMRQGELVRKLNVCHHEFHKVCIDNWLLQRSVLCPVCRHDIRDTQTVRRSPMLTGIMAPMASVPNEPNPVSNPPMPSPMASPMPSPTPMPMPNVPVQRDINDMLPSDLMNLLFGRSRDVVESYPR